MRRPTCRSIDRVPRDMYLGTEVAHQSSRGGNNSCHTSTRVSASSSYDPSSLRNSSTRISSPAARFCSSQNSIDAASFTAPAVRRMTSVPSDSQESIRSSSSRAGLPMSASYPARPAPGGRR